MTDYTYHVKVFSGLELKKTLLNCVKYLFYFTSILTNYFFT